VKAEGAASRQFCSESAIFGGFEAYFDANMRDAHDGTPKKTGRMAITALIFAALHT
jgi:hypothetical protein